MRPRSLGRRLALQYLYMADLNGFGDVESPRAFLLEHGARPEANAFAQDLVARVLARRETVDRLLAEAAEHWDLARVAPVERNVLRIACVELMEGSVPPKAVLNEAVSLAKKFGGRDSGGFVNGLLDRIYHQRLAAGTTDDEREGDPAP